MASRHSSASACRGVRNGLAWRFRRLDATSSDDSTVRIWDMKEGRQLKKFPYRKTVLAVGFSHNNHRIATATYACGGKEVHAIRTANVAEVWELESGQRLASLSYQGLVSEIAFSPDGRCLRPQTYQSEESGSASAFMWLW